MLNILIITREKKNVEKLSLSLTQKGYTCALVTNDEKVTEQIAEHTPNLVLVETNSHTRIKELSQQIKQTKNLPIIALVDIEMPDMINGHLGLSDDFVTKPYRLNELEFRIKRLLLRESRVNNDEQIKRGDMIIDLAKYEVSVDGQPILLTFREYQLLKFLASSPGRVFSRETLLNKVWGYEYYGGDRTVDVHIKRLRTKIEDANHTFIETVRNIGYRLRGEN
ncbi:MAG: response regulator transcription factor [Dehalococcoidales bacterium]|nr:response regulator transcription factor [Dehalococcoidales bacterium]